MASFDTGAELLAAGGTELGAGPWLEVDQERINAFADATGDQQWIHVDTERAATGPFGTTVAHGYLTLSLLAPLLAGLLEVPGAAMGVNYGVNRVRFPSAVPAGSRLRATARIAETADIGGGVVQIVVSAVVEREGSSKPACVADMVARYYFG